MTRKRIAINGFGRIGRAVARIILQHHSDSLELVAINDPSPGETAAILFEFDSNFGKYLGKVSFDASKQEYDIDGQKVKKITTREIENLPWKELNIDVVVEATGVFRKKEDCEKHIIQGAKKVLLSSPAKTEGFVTIIVGANEDILKQDDKLISCASCTTNCLAPFAKVLEEELGIVSGVMTTIHSYTTSQKILDMGDKKDLRRGRAAAINMIPTTTGAAKAIGLVLPELKGKLDGLAIRVPTPTVSLVDLTIKTKKKVSVEEVNAILRLASERKPDILGYEERPLVSSDFKMDPRSSIIIADKTMVNDDLIKILSWYDNEWGYSSRMVDLLKLM